MKEELIKDLELIIDEKDPDKIRTLRESITENSQMLDSSGISQAIMHKINTHTDTPTDESAEGIRNVIERIKDL